VLQAARESSAPPLRGRHQGAERPRAGAARHAREAGAERAGPRLPAAARRRDHRRSLLDQRSRPPREGLPRRPRCANARYILSYQPEGVRRGGVTTGWTCRRGSVASRCGPARVRGPGGRLPSIVRPVLRGRGGRDGGQELAWRGADGMRKNRRSEPSLHPSSSTRESKGWATGGEKCLSRIRALIRQADPAAGRGVEVADCRSGPMPASSAPARPYKDKVKMTFAKEPPEGPSRAVQLRPRGKVRRRHRPPRGRRAGREGSEGSLFAPPWP